MYNLVYKIYECYKTQNNLPLKKNIIVKPINATNATNTKNATNATNTKNATNAINSKNATNETNTKNATNETNTKNAINHYNDKIKKYAIESLKKSIKKIEDNCMDPDYKIKIFVANAFNDDYYNCNCNCNCNRKKIFKIIAGTTTIYFSLYLVYSFMKRYRT